MSVIDGVVKWVETFTFDGLEYEVRYYGTFKRDGMTLHAFGVTDNLPTEHGYKPWAHVTSDAAIVTAANKAGISTKEFILDEAMIFCEALKMERDRRGGR